MSIQKINIWFDKFDRRFAGVADEIGETAFEYFKGNFSKAQWEGVPWPKRKDSKPHLLLRKSNNLFSSINYEVKGRNRVTVSAGRKPKVSYARIHNEGGWVKGVQKVRPHVKNNFMGKGKAVGIKGYTRNVNFQMPRRQFMGPSQILNNQIVSRLKEYFNSK